MRRSQALGVLAIRMAELDGVEPAAPPGSEAVSARAGELLADLVEPAKSTALEKLGEDERALSIAVGWLRPKLQTSA